MWFKQGMISLDNLIFDMENYYSLVDVKLLWKRILDSYCNKCLCRFCIAVRRFHARVQSSICTNYEKRNNDRANSEISFKTNCLYSFWDRRKAKFFILCPAFSINFYRSKEKFSQIYWAIIDRVNIPSNLMI